MAAGSKYLLMVGLALGALNAYSQTTFTNSTAITCGGGLGAAAVDFAVGTSCAPYPSNIAVSGLSGTISNVSVRLNNLTVEREQDMIVLLVGPNGNNLILLSDAGRNTTSNTTGVTLTLSDSGASAVAQDVGFTTGTFRPSGYNGGLLNRKDNFASPAPSQASLVYPATAGAATLAQQFNGINPNGTWSLYVMDDALGPAGGTLGINVTGGWSIIITTALASVSTNTTVQSSQNPSFTAANVTFTASVTAGGNPVTSGSVTFFVDNVQQGSAVALNGAGQATFNTAGLAEGSHTIRADYGGATGFNTSNGSVTQIVNNQTTVTGSTFCNTGSITITDGNVATPYPSNIFVTGQSGTIQSMNLQLKLLTANRPDDFDLMLVGPGGQRFVFMSDVGTTTNAVTNLNLTFDDGAGSQLPDEAILTSGTFRPTAVGTGDTFPAPAPASPTFAAPAGSGTFSNLFGGTNPNGTWAMYVFDDGLGGGNSTVSGGWCLAFTVTSTPATTTTVTSSANPSFTGNNVTFTATVRQESNNAPITQGTVTFREGSTILAASVPLNASGQASFNTSSLTEGTHTISADYNGVIGTFNISTGSLTQNVDNATAVTGTTFCNPGPLNLNDSGPATQYPQRIFVSGLSGVIQNMTLQLRGLTTGRPDDLDLLLLGPNGAKFVFMSDAGGVNAVSNQTLTFDDSAANSLPDSTALVTGTFRPTSYNFANTNTFPAPAPAAPWSDAAPIGTATFASLFQGAPPNGTWELYAMDDGLGGGAGTAQTGYCLTFTLASDLTISKTHTGNFTQGQTGAQYSITVSNVGAFASTGLVTVTEIPPAGLTVTALSGSGWNCNLGALTCDRNDGLAGNSSFPPITVTVNVAANAPPSVTNQATVSGGGDLNGSNNTASDPTTVIALVPLTFNTSPAGLSFSVNGTPYTTQQILSLPVGSQVTIATTTNQGNASTRYVFQNWTDNGDISHTFNVPATATTYTANFTTEHFLTTQVSPAGGGTIAPPSGFFPAGSSIPVTATVNPGFTFASFSGALSGAANPQNLTLNGPATVTANFNGSGAALSSLIVGKSGPANARVWTFRLSNSGAGTAVNAQLDGLSFVQQAGAACTPVITSGLPASAGTIAPAGTGNANVTINFSGCAANARFRATWTFSANGGLNTGTMTLFNQFQ